MTGRTTLGVLVGDFDRSGVCDGTEKCIFWNVSEATWLVSNNKPPADKRFDMGRVMVAGWLNFLAYAGLPSNVRWAFQASVHWMNATTNSTLDPGNLWAYSQPGPVPASSPAWSGANLIFGNLVRG